MFHTCRPVQLVPTDPRMDQTRWSGSHSPCRSESFSAAQQTDLPAETRHRFPLITLRNSLKYLDSDGAHSLPTTLLSSLSRYMFHIRLPFSSSLWTKTFPIVGVRGVAAMGVEVVRRRCLTRGARGPRWTPWAAPSPCWPHYADRPVRNAETPARPADCKSTVDLTFTLFVASHQGNF